MFFILLDPFNFHLYNGVVLIHTLRSSKPYITFVSFDDPHAKPVLINYRERWEIVLSRMTHLAWFFLSFSACESQFQQRDSWLICRRKSMCTGAREGAKRRRDCACRTSSTRRSRSNLTAPYKRTAAGAQATAHHPSDALLQVGSLTALLVFVTQHFHFVLNPI